MVPSKKCQKISNFGCTPDSTGYLNSLRYAVDRKGLGVLVQMTPDMMAEGADCWESDSSACSPELPNTTFRWHIAANFCSNALRNKKYTMLQFKSCKNGVVEMQASWQRHREEGLAPVSCKEERTSGCLPSDCCSARPIYRMHWSF